MHVIDVLRGSNAEKLQKQGHHHLTTFGIGKDKPAEYWKQLAWQLIHRDFCYQDVMHYNVLKLTPKAIPVLRGEEKVTLAVQPPPVPSKEKSQKKTSRGASSTTTANPLFDALRTLRRALADEENKPPFMIFSDVTLHDMIRVKPKTLADMLTVFGVGQQKLNHYGPAFLEVLHEKTRV
jgi:ATP-dependent DNA helicase RecQ